MTKRRIQRSNPQIGANIYSNGKEMFEGIFLGVLNEGVPGLNPHCSNLGANRWQTNLVSVIEDIDGPLANPNMFMYPANRWRTYLWDYVGPDGVDGIRDAMRMGLAGHGDALWMTHTKEHHQGMRAHNEKGNCFMGVSFRSKPEPAVTMFSRTVMIPAMGALDIAFGQLLTREWWKILNTSTMPTFNWYTASVCITPFHATMSAYNMGLYEIGEDPTKETLRNASGQSRFGSWPSSHFVSWPPDYMNNPDIPTMTKSVIQLSDEFLQDDDYDRSIPGRSKFAQYVRMQRKLRKVAYGDLTPSWFPVLPDEWFADLRNQSVAWAKDYRKRPLPMFGSLEKSDFPKGHVFEAPEGVSPFDYYDRYTTQYTSWEDLL